MAGQLELADDLRPQQGDDVRGDAEPEPGEDLLGDGRATEDVAPLEDQRRSGRPAPGRRPQTRPLWPPPMMTAS